MNTCGLYFISEAWVPIQMIIDYINNLNNQIFYKQFKQYLLTN